MKPSLNIFKKMVSLVVSFGPQSSISNIYVSGYRQVIQKYKKRFHGPSDLTGRTLYVLILILVISNSLRATEYDVDKSKKNVVKFISEATIENFEGVTNSIDGYLFFKGDDFLSESDLYFEVDLRTLDTGIGLRNRHMREDYLETDKYPMTNFKGKIVYVQKVSDTESKVTLDGNLFIHGVTKPMKINGNLFQVEGGYRVKAYFEILLTDYNIEIPKLMFMKISNTIKLALDFYVKEKQK